MKMSKDEGYEQLKGLMEFWPIREHALENCDMHIDNWMHDYGRYTYDQALAWTKGISYKDREEFLKTPSMDGYIEDFGRQYCEEFEDEFDAIPNMILQLVFKIIKPRLDLEIKRDLVVIQTREKTITEKFFICPSCGHENGTSRYTSDRNLKCHVCQKTYDVKIN